MDNAESIRFLLPSRNSAGSQFVIGLELMQQTITSEASSYTTAKGFNSPQLR